MPLSTTNQPRRRLWFARRVAAVVILSVSLLVVFVWGCPSPQLYPSLPRVTRTSHGAAGDPLNVLMIGSKPQLDAAFARASWRIPDPITPATSARIAADSLAHRAYPAAPVSSLYVFGRPQDLAFEWPTNDVQNRGHIRLWRTALQLDGQPVWLGAASYDHGIELSGTTGLPTHHISPAVDLERDTVGANLARSGLVTGERYAPYTQPILVAHNGGGDYYASDGEVLLISLQGSNGALPAPSGAEAAVAGLTRRLFHAYVVVLTTLSLLIATLAALTSLAVLLLWPLLVRSWRWLVRRWQSTAG